MNENEMGILGRHHYLEGSFDNPNHKKVEETVKRIFFEAKEERRQLTEYDRGRLNTMMNVGIADYNKIKELAREYGLNYK